jgi:hypothetical protein
MRWTLFIVLAFASVTAAQHHHHELRGLQASTSPPETAIASSWRTTHGFRLFAGARPPFALSTAKENNC